VRIVAVVLLSLAVVALVTGLSFLRPSDRLMVMQPKSDSLVQNVQTNEDPSEPVSANVIHPEPASASSPLPAKEIANSATDFDKLPLEQQQEIIELSGRESDVGKSYQTMEVAPGVVAVMANNGPKVVPVAVINEDGTVSIHEH
jgi:hypothetical protein